MEIRSPSNVELRERILAEKVALRDELRSHAWFARSSNFNRYLMLVELSFYLADIILDFQMFWLYQDRQHYWLAAAQGFIILRTIDLGLKHLKRIVCSSWLLSDGILSGRISEQMLSCAVLSLLQSEKTGEAVLSMFLQIYGLFYMITDPTSYWMASLSLVLSAGGITYGCYIYFDLAVVLGEMPADIMPRQRAQ